MMRKSLFLLLPLMLGACAETRDFFGLGRRTPDEFVVLDRAPLAVPPDFTLRPPQPGAPRPQESSATKTAEQAVLGAPSATTATSSLGAEILAKSGAEKAQPDIRAQLDRDALAEGDAGRRLVDELLVWRKGKAQSDTVVDAATEAQRLKDNQAKGKPANSGATPVIEKSKSGWLGL
jgi:hypothetical protein